MPSNAGAAHEPRALEALSIHRGDPLFHLLLDRWQLPPWGIGLLTALTGFGVLSVWYGLELAWHPSTRALRGFFDFYSATWGDALFLPVLNVLAVQYCLSVAGGLERETARAAPGDLGELRGLDRAYNRPLVAASITFVSVLVAVALGWRDAMGAERNWTLPVRGRMTFAGVYHQAFLAIQAYLLLYLSHRHLTTVRIVERLASRTPQQASLASFSWDALERFNQLFLGWGAFASLRLMDHTYGMESGTLMDLLLRPRARDLLAGYLILWLVLSAVPALILLRRLGADRPPLRFWLVLPGILAVPLLGPALLVAPSH